MPAHPASSLPVYLLIGLITAAIFAVDLVTRLGVAEWVLYLLPVALSMLQPRLVVPLVVAAIATVLVVVGLFFSPPSGSLMQVIVNRSMGLVAIWSTAILVHRVLRGRAHEQLQLWLQQGETTVTQSLAGEQSLAELGQSACTALARYTGAAVAVLHRLEDDTLHALGSSPCMRSGVTPWPCPSPRSPRRAWARAWPARRRTTASRAGWTACRRSTCASARRSAARPRGRSWSHRCRSTPRSAA